MNKTVLRLGWVLFLVSLPSVTFADNLHELYTAAKKGNLQRVNDLLSAGQTPNGWEKNFLRLSFSPLTIAVKEDHPEVVRALLAAKADVNAVAPKGAPALFWAAYHCRPGIAGQLIAAGADVNLGDLEGRQAPIYIAAAFGCDPVLNLLIAAKADVNRRKIDGATALMTASARKNISSVKILLEAGADVLLADSSGRTALDYASEANAADVQALLKEHGVTSSARGDQMAAAQSESSHFSLKDIRLAMPKGCPSDMDVLFYNGGGGAFTVIVSLLNVAPLLDFENGKKVIESAIRLLHSQCPNASSVPTVKFFIAAPGFDLPNNPAGVAVYRHGLGAQAELGRPVDLEFMNFALATQQNRQFTERNHVDQAVSFADLVANPFSFQGKTVSLSMKFVTMESEDIGRFSGESGEVLVSGIPSNMFTTGGSMVYLAGRVQGKTVIPGTEGRLTTLLFIDAYFCKQEGCNDIAVRHQ